MSTSDTILLAGLFKANPQTGSQNTGAGAGSAITSVTFEVYGGTTSNSSGSQNTGAGAGQVQYTDLGSFTVKLTDFGQQAYGVFALALTASTAYTSFAIQEVSTPAISPFSANAISKVSVPDGTLTLLERTV